MITIQNILKQVLIASTLLIVCSCSSTNPEKTALVGKWEGSLKDSKSGDSHEKIILEFTTNGELRQHLGEGQLQNTIESEYEVKNGQIITIEKETKERDKSSYNIVNDTLTIVYEGLTNTYIKLKQE